MSVVHILLLAYPLLSLVYFFCTRGLALSFTKRILMSAHCCLIFSGLLLFAVGFFGRLDNPTLTWLITVALLIGAGIASIIYSFFALPARRGLHWIHLASALILIASGLALFWIFAMAEAFSRG